MTFRRTALVLLAALAALPAHARADTKTGSKGPGALAVTRGDAGIALYERGQWDEAIRAFEEAEALFHSPVFVLYMARSLRNSGRLLEARAAFRRLDEEALAETAPEPWKRAQADGRGELATLEQDVPSVVIILKNGSVDSRITLDGAPARAGQHIEIDPGKHAAAATDGERRVEKPFVAEHGAEQQRIVLTLPVARDAGAPGRGPYVPGLILAGAGGAALIGGAVFGAIAVAKESDATQDCENGTCPPSQQGEIESRLDDARTLATVADVLFVGGAVLAVTGVVLYIVDPRGDAPVKTAGSLRGGTLAIRF